jgi:methylmalonyl-CoA mutase C-terminal domain/subunit
MDADERRTSRPPRILMTKIGFDGHDRGSRIVAAYLRDAGMEVVYTGPWQTVPDVVQMALQEDVEVIGISSLASDHLIVPKLTAALADAGLTHVAVVVGGIVPDVDLGLLAAAGVARVYHPGATREEIVSSMAALAERARALGAAME